MLILLINETYLAPLCMMRGQWIWVIKHIREGNMREWMCNTVFILCECESMSDSWDPFPHAPVKKDLYFTLCLWLTLFYLCFNHLLKCKVQKKKMTHVLFPPATFTMVLFKLYVVIFPQYYKIKNIFHSDSSSYSNNSYSS